MRQTSPCPLETGDTCGPYRAIAYPTIVPIKAPEDNNDIACIRGIGVFPFVTITFHCSSHEGSRLMRRESFSQEIRRE